MTTSGRFGPEVAPPTAPPTAPAVAPAAAPWSVAMATVGRAKRAAAEARARIELRMVTLLLFQMMGERDAAKPVPAVTAQVGVITRRWRSALPLPGASRSRS